MIRSTRMALVGAVALAAWLVGPAPARANFCHLTWDTPCCPIPGCPLGVADAVLTICNTKSTEGVYEWTLADPVVPPFGLSFSPASGTAVVPPGRCVDIRFKVYCPLGVLPPGVPRIYFANVVKVSGPTLIQFGCEGSVVNPGPIKVTPSDQSVVVAPGRPARVQLTIENMGTVPMPFNLSLELMPPTAPIEIIPLSLTGIVQPGEALTPGDEITVILYPAPGLALGRGWIVEEGENFDVLIMADVNGDSVPEAISSIAGRVRRLGPCAADLNGDSVVDTADLGLMLQAFGELCVP